MRVFYILLACVGTTAMGPRSEYFETLRNKCTSMECMRRVGVCHNFVFNSFSARFQPLALKCSAAYTDTDMADLCAHIALGDYNSNGTMRPQVLKNHIMKYFCNEHTLLGDLLVRFQVCDSYVQATKYLDCILEGCLSS